MLARCDGCHVVGGRMPIRRSYQITWNRHEHISRKDTDLASKNTTLLIYMTNQMLHRAYCTLL